jgi:hypothetical protein
VLLARAAAERGRARARGLRPTASP